MIFVSLLDLNYFCFTLFLLFVFLVVLSFFGCCVLMSAVFLNWCEISFDFYSSKHGLYEVFEAVSSYVAECLGVIIVIGQIFALDFAFIESFCSIIRFFVVSLFFKQFGLLGLNSKISLARTYLNQVELVQVVVVVAVK